MSKLLSDIKAFLEVDVKAIRDVQSVVQKELSKGIKVRIRNITSADKNISGRNFDKEVTDIFDSSKDNTVFKNKEVNTDLFDDQVILCIKISSLKNVTRNSYN